MNLTIEKAKEIIDNPSVYPEIYDEYDPLGHTKVYRARGFIEGWNQAIEKSVKIIMGSVSSEYGHLLCNKNPYQLASEINELKVKGEK